MKKKIFCTILSLFLLTSAALAVQAVERNGNTDYELEQANVEDYDIDALEVDEVNNEFNLRVDEPEAENNIELPPREHVNGLTFEETLEILGIISFSPPEGMLWFEDMFNSGLDLVYLFTPCENLEPLSAEELAYFENLFRNFVATEEVAYSNFNQAQNICCTITNNHRSFTAYLGTVIVGSQNVCHRTRHRAVLGCMVCDRLLCGGNGPVFYADRYHTWVRHTPGWLRCNTCGRTRMDGRPTPVNDEADK